MLKLRRKKLSRVLVMAESRRLRVVLLTGRTIEQGVEREFGKSSEGYAESVSICFIDSEDLHAMGIKEDSNVSISTAFGSVILRAVKSPRGPHEGVVFVPYGPWANMVFSRTGYLSPVLKKVKGILDPNNVMNPGKLGF